MFDFGNGCMLYSQNRHYPNFQGTVCCNFFINEVNEMAVYEGSTRRYLIPVSICQLMMSVSSANRMTRQTPARMHHNIFYVP